MDGLLTTELAALAAGVKPATIRQWVRRGHVRACAGQREVRSALVYLDDVTAVVEARSAGRRLPVVLAEPAALA